MGNQNENEQKRVTHKKRGNSKKKWIWFILTIIVVVSIMIGIRTFLNVYLFSSSKESIIYNKDGIHITYQPVSNQKFQLTLQSEREEQIYIGVTDLQINGQQMQTNAQTSNPRYAELQGINISNEDGNPLILSSFIIQKELGIYYVDQSKLQTTSEQLTIQYEPLTSTNETTTSNDAFSFVLTIYTVPKNVENFSNAGFAAVNEQYKFIYLNEKGSVKVKSKN